MAEDTSEMTIHEACGSSKDKAFALVEVIMVRFVIYALLARVLLITLFGGIETQNILAAYVVGSLWFIIPFGVVMVTRRDRSSFGFTLRPIRRNVDRGMSAFLVLLIALMGFGILSALGWSYLEPRGAMLLTSLFSISLILVVLLIGRDDEEQEISNSSFYGDLIIIMLLLVLPILGGFVMGQLSILLVSTVIWQFVFSGFGEEAFFRGYIQSRLNEAFGRPYEVKGVNFGVGLIISALIFSISHMLNTFDLYTLTGQLAIWWGTFTFVGGLIFGLLKEWSGSIMPGGIAHGLEAFGEAIGILFS
ncbi:CPBP family intramembrane metalloprotease [Candidatus Thorarchaeota archaeon]|nr:MAG: CPBP family intramembrane metalloprotease [Candidatus Thorarchaeota archaeon]